MKIVSGEQFKQKYGQEIASTFQSEEKPNTFGSSISTDFKSKKDLSFSEAPAGKFIAEATPEISKDFYKRGENINEIIKEGSKNISDNPNPEQIGPAGNAVLQGGKTLLSALGEVGAGVGDLFIDLFKAGKNNLIPEDIKKSEGYQDIKKALNYDNLRPEWKELLGNLGLKAKENPEIAKALVDSLNLTSFVVPGAANTVKNLAVKELRNAAGQLIDEAGNVIDRSIIAPIKDTANAVKNKAGEIIDDVKSKTKEKIPEIIAQTPDEKLEGQVWDIVQPKLSSKEQIIARKKGLIDETTFGKTKLMPDDAFDQELIEYGKRWIDPKAKTTEQLKTISDRVSQLNQTNKSFLRQNDGIFNTSELSNFLKGVKGNNAARRAVIFGGDESLEKAYDSMVDAFMTLMKKRPNKYSSVLEARQEFDSLADSVIPKAFDAEARDTVKKIALRDIRRGANDFVAERVKGGKAILDSLREESVLLEIIDNIAEKAPKVGTSAYKRAKDKFPLTTKTAEAAIKGAGLGVGLGFIP